jgi:hypothetical protein
LGKALCSKFSLHGRFDHKSSASWSMQKLMDQCSRYKVHSTICVSKLITASIAGFPSSSKRMNIPSVYVRSKMICRLLVTQ